MRAGWTRRVIVGMVVAVLAVTGTIAPVAGRDPQRNAGGHKGQPLQRLGVAEPVPNVHPVANNTVGIKSDRAYYDDTLPTTVAWVVGEVWNRIIVRREFISVTATFRNGDTVIGSSPPTQVYLGQLAPGMTSPFLVEFESNAILPTTTYSLSLDPGDQVIPQPAGALRIAQGTTTSGGGEVFYHGTVYNPNNFPVELADANVTLYDSAGDVIDVNFGYTTPATIPAFGSGTYEVGFFIPMGGLGVITKVGVVSQGWRAGTDSYVTSWSNYFEDIRDTSFRNDIIWLAENSISFGCAPGKYCPDNNVRRDEMASFLSRSLGLGGTPPDAFVDDTGNTHELNINRIAAAHITTGCNATLKLYCPANNVRRDEMASFLSRSLGLTGTPPDAFVDDNGNTHELNINRIAAADITTGCNATLKLYCPSQNVTRGQMAAFLKRSFGP